MRTLLLAVTALLLVPSALSAQGWIEPPLRFPGEFGVVKTRTDVTVRVVGRVAHVEVEEWFQNRGGGLAEGDYLYPLPGEAVFSNYSLFQGDQELRGETMDAERARAIYEEIVRRKKDPALIELAGHGLIRARVFPINPGETRKITLRYNQVLGRAGDALQFRYAAGGRHGGMFSPGGEGPTIPQRVQERAPVSFTLIVEQGAMFRDPFSPTHEVRVAREGGRLTVRPQDEIAGDFNLFLPLAENLVGIALAAHRPSGEPGYFMLTLSPGEATAAAQPRDVTAVVDVSGSMSGSKIEQARQALRQLLGTLSREDRFRLIAFSSGVRAFATDWTQATADALQRARGWVDALNAEGGTNIAGALQEAFRVRSPEGRLAIVVFLTDGLPSVGEENPERIAQQVEDTRGAARVFAFGVGYDVNTYLLDRLTAAGRGSTQYVQPDQNVEQALGVLAAKIRLPVLTDLQIEHAPVRLVEVYPSPLPDLFSGEELVIFGRYELASDAQEGAVVVAGRRAGRGERFATRVTFPEHENTNDFIPRLWASRKIGFLMRSIRLNGENPELVREIRETALRYGLLSEYTAYLVQEPEAVALPGRPAPAQAPVAFMNGAGAATRATQGQASVMASERARMRREAKSAADLKAAEAEMAEAAMGAAPGARTDLRVVAGRQFLRRDGVWTDAGHKSTAKVVSIEPFSDAYFKLLRLAPELKPYLSSFDQVLIAGGKVSIKVAPGGVKQMPDAALSNLVRDYRAS